MSMTFLEFTIANRKRTAAKTGFNHPIDGWNLSDWMTALTGEVGEAANIVKKLNRYRYGIAGNSESEVVLKDRLQQELADVFCYLDLIVARTGSELEHVVKDRWNATSAKIGYPERL